MLAEIAIPPNTNLTTYVKPKTPEELGLDVDKQGIYVMCETPWAKAMSGEYQQTGKYTLQFGVGDTTSATMRERFSTLSSSKDLLEQKFFIDAIPNPGYRDHKLHRVIRETFAYQVSPDPNKREVFAVAVPDALAEMFIKSGDFEPVRDWLSKKIRQCASKLNKDHAKMSVDLRELQDYVIAKIIKNLHKNGINANIIAELAPRLGKTLMFLAMAKQMREDPKLGHEAMFVLAYGVGLSVKASYKEEIEKYQDFVDFEFIDNADDNAQERYANAIANGKFPVVFVSLNAKVGNDEKEERLDWIGTRTEKAIALLEETDFGVHTDSQIEKTQNMFANMTVTQINSSGTNIGRIAKASGDKAADAIIRVPYSMVEQQAKAKEYGIVKRKFYNMTFDSGLNSLLENYDENVLPNITKILKKSKSQERFISAVFRDMFGYDPIYGLNLADAISDTDPNIDLNCVMLFASLTINEMTALKSVIETACDEHQVLILNSEYTSNKEAQGRTLEELVALKNGKYGKRNKLIILTNMMGTRSYSIPQIKACLFMAEGGDVYPYMQKYSRCLTPGDGKEYGHIFDFAFDTNKTRNTEMSIAIDAAAIMEQEKISFPDAIRKVMFSVGLKDMMQGKWLDANDIIARFEDNDKLVEVADALSRVGVEDFNDVDFPFLAELAKRAMSKKEKSDFEKTIKTGKTYETKKREGIDTTPEEDKEYLKALQDMKKTIERAIRMLNSSASTVTEFANYQGKTYEQCLDIIKKDAKLSAEFFEMFGVDVSFVKGIKGKLPLPTLDLIVERTIHGDSSNNVANSSLGIIADSPELWKEILSTRAMRRKLNSNKCKRILVVAGGLGTEIDVLVELYGIDIVDKIVYNDKYTSFCNRIKKKYPQLTVMQGDFLELEFDMKFDVGVGNPPYKSSRANIVDGVKHSYLEHAFTHKMMNMCDTVALVLPTTFNSDQATEMRNLMQGNVETIIKGDKTWFDAETIPVAVILDNNHNSFSYKFINNGLEEHRNFDKSSLYINVSADSTLPNIAEKICKYAKENGSFADKLVDLYEGPHIKSSDEKSDTPTEKLKVPVPVNCSESLNVIYMEEKWQSKRNMFDHAPKFKVIYPRQMNSSIPGTQSIKWAVVDSEGVYGIERNNGAMVCSSLEEAEFIANKIVDIPLNVLISIVKHYTNRTGMTVTGWSNIPYIFPNDFNDIKKILNLTDTELDYVKDFASGWSKGNVY